MRHDDALTIDTLRDVMREIDKADPWRAWLRKVGEQNFSLQESAYLPVSGDGFVIDNRTTLGTIMVVVPDGWLSKLRAEYRLPDREIAASIAWKKLIVDGFKPLIAKDIA
jgi:hypothetical protein